MKHANANVPLEDQNFFTLRCISLFNNLHIMNHFYFCAKAENKIGKLDGYFDQAII